MIGILNTFNQACIYHTYLSTFSHFILLFSSLSDKLTTLNRAFYSTTSFYPMTTLLITSFLLLLLCSLASASGNVSSNTNTLRLSFASNSLLSLLFFTRYTTTSARSRTKVLIQISLIHTQNQARMTKKAHFGYARIVVPTIRPKRRRSATRLVKRSTDDHH